MQLQFIKLALSLFMLMQFPTAISATSDANERKPTQAPIRMLEYKVPSDQPNNSAHDSTCVPGQCPEPRPARSKPASKRPSQRTPTTLPPAGGAPIPTRPVAKFISPLPKDNQPYEPNQLLLLFPNHGIANTRILAIKKQHQLDPFKRISLDTLGGELVVYNTKDQSLPDLKKSLARLAPEATIEFNFYYQSLKGPRQYFSKKINMVKPTRGDNNTPIGIIDTAVAETPALSHATIVQKNFISTTSKQATKTHGTGLALLIAGKDEKNNFYGMTPESPLFVAGVMRQVNKRNNTNSLLLAQALNWLVEKQVKIINLSLGGPKDAIMSNIFKLLRKQPVILVAAAGNSGPQAAPQYPAAYSGVIAVTATNANNQIYKHANRGSYIDLAAPGEDIWMPITTGGQYLSGTSFSAALVSGVISQLISAQSALSTKEVKHALCAQTIDLGPTGRDDTYGCGLLQSITTQSNTLSSM